MSEMTFEQLRETVGDEDHERLLSVAKAAGVEIPLDQRFYIKNHTPRKTKNNPEPTETEYVVLPSPSSSRELWVQRGDFNEFLQAAQSFKERLG